METKLDASSPAELPHTVSEEVARVEQAAAVVEPADSPMPVVEPAQQVQAEQASRNTPTEVLIKESTLVKLGANRIEMELLTRGKP